MNIGILVINEGESVSDRETTIDVCQISKTLNERGYFVESVIFVCKKEKLAKSFELLISSSEALLVCGNTDMFFEFIGEKYEVNSRMSTINIDGVACAVTPEYNSVFLHDTLLPMLNSKCKTYYATSVFKTFDKTVDQLKDMLKDYIKNRNRIFFKFYPSLMECEVHMRYSNKTSKDVVDAMIASVTAILADCTYSLSESSLAQTVANLLILRGKKLGLAESFTGGGVANSLVLQAGISSSLKEAIVCYSNESKIWRLQVDPAIIERFGAVSIETVYEMAASILMNGGCDLAVATSGNAGPTSEKPNENGVCFIAVGNSKAIHIYKYNFEGDRATVIQSGIKCALFRLYKLLRENEFENILKSQNI